MGGFFVGKFFSQLQEMSKFGSYNLSSVLSCDHFLLIQSTIVL